MTDGSPYAGHPAPRHVYDYLGSHLAPPLRRSYRMTKKPARISQAPDIK
jgi:hypothetical protein